MEYSDKREIQLSKESKVFLLNERLCRTNTETYACIPYHAIDTILTAAELEDFNSWIRGQTSCEHGIYWHDWERWVKGLPVID